MKDNMETFGIYEKKVERDITENLFTKYNKKKKGANSEESEIREKILNLLNSRLRKTDKPLTFTKVCGLTKFWTHQEMFEAYQKAIKFEPNPPALMRIFIKTNNQKIKQQLKT